MEEWGHEQEGGAASTREGRSLKTRRGLERDIAGSVQVGFDRGFEGGT